MDLLESIEKIRSDPWEFVKCVRTKDEADSKQAIKPFPLEHEYLRLYTKIWMIERKIAVPKSRRMMMSWMNIILYVWDTMFHIGRSNAFVSKKEEDAADLIERAKFIIDNLDHSKIPKEFIPKYQHTFNKLKFPEIDSQIRGFPQGADQLRQFTFSGLFFDEAAFWEEAEAAYSAALPTIDGSGRITMVSSAAPGFFSRVVHDTIERGDDDGDNVIYG
jgi:hypothetical protein